MDKIRFLKPFDSEKDLLVKKRANQEIHEMGYTLVRLFWCADEVLGAVLKKGNEISFAVWFSDHWMFKYEQEAEFGSFFLTAKYEQDIRVFVWKYLKNRGEMKEFWYPPLDKFPVRKNRTAKGGAWEYFFSREYPYN